MAGQVNEKLARGLVQVAKMSHSLAGRCAVWFGKYHVECDRRGLHLVEPREQLCKHGPRPGPLPVGAHAFLVDIDDHDRTKEDMRGLMF